MNPHAEGGHNNEDLQGQLTGEDRWSGSYIHSDRSFTTTPLPRIEKEERKDAGMDGTFFMTEVASMYYLFSVSDNGVILLFL